MTIVTLRQRPRHDLVYERACELHYSPLQAEIISRRLTDITGLQEIMTPRLANLPHPSLLKGCDRAARRIVQAIKNREQIGLVTDYDVDGLTSHAIMVHSFVEHFFFPRGQLASFVGHRHDDGYGVTDSLAARIKAHEPAIDLLITADCGSSDEPRLAQLAKDMDIIVTDHHLLSADNLPHSAFSVVNPQQEQCAYPDKDIAGCMVCWLLMSRVRTMLVAEEILLPKSPKLGNLLDFVALGTVADNMNMQSPVNRVVVKVGLDACRSGGRPCWQEIPNLLGKKRALMTEEDFSFQVAPRLNAASRMAHPQVALELLLAVNQQEAQQAWRCLEDLNDQRKEAQQEAGEICQRLIVEDEEKAIIVVSHPGFHPGILGIIASRLADMYGCPALVATLKKDVDNVLIASGRSVAGLDLRALLMEIDQIDPGCLLSYGGHAGAVGLTLPVANLTRLRQQLTSLVTDRLATMARGAILEIDGPLAASYLQAATVEELTELSPYGRGFALPCFHGDFTVISRRFVGQEKNHLQLTLRLERQQVKAIWFRCADKGLDFVQPGAKVRVCYEMAMHYFRGKKGLQLLVRQLFKLEDCAGI